MQEKYKKTILKTSYEKPIITEETIENIINHPVLHTGCSVRTKMGKVYTDEEYATRCDRIMNTPLPNVEKGKTLCKSRIFKKKR